MIEEKQRYEQIVKVLAFLSRQMAAADSFEQRLKAVLESLGEACDAHFLGIFENYRQITEDKVRHVASWFAPDFQIVDSYDFSYHVEGLDDIIASLAAGEQVWGAVNERPLSQLVTLIGLDAAVLDLEGVVVSSIIADGQWLGFLLMAGKEPMVYWSDRELDLLSGITAVIGSALEKRRLLQLSRRTQRQITRLQEATGQRLAEQNALLAATTMISSSLDLNEVLAMLAQQMARSVDATSAYISDWQPELGTSTVLAEYYSPVASPKERLSDLGKTYIVREAFGEDIDWLLSNEASIDHVDDLQVPHLLRQHMKEYGAYSVLTVPLMVKEQLVGYSELWESRGRRDFSPREIRLCQAIARQAAVALENARLFAAERRQLHLARTLQKVGTLLTTSLSLEAVYEQIFELLAEVIDYDSVAIQLIGEDRRLYMAAGRGFPDFERAREFVEEITDSSLQRCTPEHPLAVIPDTYNDPDWILAAGQEYIRSWIGVALLVKGRMIGALNLDSARPNTYNQTLGETVVAFANQAAVAIENARLYDEVRQQANEAAILHDVAVATSGALELDSLLAKTTRMISKQLYPDHFGFLIVDHETETIHPHPSYHGIAEEEYQAVIPFDGSVSGLVARSGEPQIITDVSTLDLYYDVLADTFSEIAVPVKVGKRVIAVINVESAEPHAFDINDLRFLTTLAAQVSAAIERTQFYEAQKEYTAHLAQEVNRRTAELQAERDRMQAILDSAGEGIFFTDPQGLVQYVNPAMTWLTGYDDAEILGQTLHLWHSDPQKSESFQFMWSAIMDGRSWSGELLSRRKGGLVYDATLTIAPIHAASGELTGFVGVQSDISRLKEVERLKSKFISNVSHELRTPLANIGTYTTLLQRGKTERREYYLDVITRETKRLTRLIQNVLDLSRLDAETIPVNLHPTAVKALVEEVAGVFAVRALEKEIDLQVSVPDHLPAAMIDVYQIEQVVTNLVANALAYTGRQGRVTVTAGTADRNDETMLWVKVEDNGIGIAPDDIPRLFERFFRSKAVEESGVPGTGLGLPICKEIIERHNGEIGVESVLGVGSAFTIWLKLAV